MNDVGDEEEMDDEDDDDDDDAFCPHPHLKSEKDGGAFSCYVLGTTRRAAKLLFGHLHES